MKRYLLVYTMLLAGIGFAAVTAWPPRSAKAKKRTAATQTDKKEPKAFVKTHPEEESPSSEGMDDDAGERLAWELKRLCDPATGKIPDNIRQKELAYAATLPSDAHAKISTRSIPNWTNRGPWNVGGRTRAFGVDIANENHLLAGSCSGGMWLTTDGGARWAACQVASQLKNATCLVQDVRTGHTNTWYYGSGEGTGASPSADGAYYLGDGLFKSTDNGNNWTQVSTTAAGAAQTFSTNWQLVWNLAMDRSAHDTTEEIYAACYNSIYRSENGGKTWSIALDNCGYYTDVAVSPTGVVYISASSDGASKGIWRSNDGKKFTKILPSNFPTGYKRMVLEIDPTNENRVYVLAHTPGSGKLTRNYLGDPEYNSLYRYEYIKGNGSGDTGGVWTNLSANLPATGGQFDKWNVQGGYDMVIKVKPDDSNTLFIGGTNLYRSTTAFRDSTHTTFIGGYEQFSKLPTINSYTNHHPDQHGIFFSYSNPTVMYSYNDGGISRTADNMASQVVWNSLNNGYITSMFYTVAIDHATSGNNVIIGGAQDNGSWFTGKSNPLAAWVQPRGGDGSYCAIADGRSMYYFSIQNAKMMKTTLDAAGNKTAFTRIDPIGLKNPQFINPFVLDPNNNNIMYLAGGKYLWRNSDLSGIPMVSGWDSISTNWTRWADSVPVANVKISCVTACKTPANRVYYGTENRKLYRVDNANTGTPKPTDITSTTSGSVFPGGSNISCVAADPRDGDKIMAVFSNYNTYSIFYSTDAGSTWSRQGGNLEPSDNSGPSIRWATIFPVSDGTIYMLATSTGIYATTTLAGASTIWVQQGSNEIGNAVCDMIDYRSSDGLVVVATHSNGIFSATYTTVSNIVGVSDPDYQDLSIGVYPNPASSQLTLRASISGPVQCEIWDECGRILMQWDSKSSGTGVFPGTVSWNLEAYKPGIYYLHVTAAEGSKTVKFSVIR